ncbi:MAG: bifunctional riboflavin kinase/FAD synthetase [Pseudomonadota bacterium]
MTGSAKATIRGRVAALGNFDGVHRGHAALIAAASEAAKAMNAPLAAAAFTPHPRIFFGRDERPFLLTTTDQRARLLEALGVSTLYELLFDKALASLSPDAFVEQWLADVLGLRGVVVGADFCFGKGRAGNAEALAKLAAAHGIEAVIVDPKLAPGGTAVEDKFSSTDARAAIRDGDPKAAAEILGRHWSVEGVVETGDRRGRLIGFPTANLRLGATVRPKYGVYAVRVRLSGEQASRPAVANMGLRPTFGGADELLEAHIFDFDEDIYGRIIEVSFVDHIRGEKKFDGIESLKAQIAADCETARRLLGAG